MRRTLLAASLLVVPGLLLAAAPVQAGGAEVVLVRIDGVITQGTTMHVEGGIAAAEDLGVPLVIQLETPGGLVEATLDIHKAILRAQVPVLTFVGPRGAEAASAGTFILLMGHPAGMAPDTQIGSAQPITVSPDGSTQGADEKVQNFLIERMRLIAERAGRDADLAVRFITENLNMDEEEAFERGLIDAVASDAAAFLDAVHGRSAIVGDGTVTLDTRDARIIVYERPFLARLVEILSNPQIAFLLVLAGTYALVFGLANPGSYVPEVIGALLLLLGFIGLGLFSTSTAGILLLLLALLFFVAEVFTPTNGILTGVGVVAMIFAVIFLVDEPLLPRKFLRTFFFVGVALAVLSGGAVMGAVTLALRTRKRPKHDALMGARGRAIEDIDPEGRVSVFGEIWRARTDLPPLSEGSVVEVVGRDGLTLVVAVPGTRASSVTPDEEE